MYVYGSKPWSRYFKKLRVWRKLCGYKGNQEARSKAEGRSKKTLIEKRFYLRPVYGTISSLRLNRFENAR